MRASAVLLGPPVFASSCAKASTTGCTASWLAFSCCILTNKPASTLTVLFAGGLGAMASARSAGAFPVAGLGLGDVAVLLLAGPAALLAVVLVSVDLRFHEAISISWLVS